MDYRYTYLILDLVLFILWAALFVWRRDTRKEMAVMSIMFALAGLPADYIYLQDWWSPQFLFPSVRIESMLFGFVFGGIASIAYEEIFKKNIRRFDANRPAKPLKLILLCLSVAVLFWISFSYFNINSFISTIIALGLPAIYMFCLRSDLLVDGLATAFLLLLTISISYTLVEFITPGWIGEFWHFTNTPEIIIGNIPIDDIIWYIFAGLFIGPLYAYWQEGRMVKQSTN